MEQFVKFCAINNKINILDNFEYVEAIFMKLVKDRIIKKYDITVLDEEESMYDISFEACGRKEDNGWNVSVEFGTFKLNKQLEFEIKSERYVTAISDNYLEMLKINLKNAIVRDWQKIIWLYDKDAEMLSVDLYSKIYVVENALRRLINELMTKECGIEWWDYIVPHNIKSKYFSRYKGYKTVVAGFNNVDEHLMSIDVGDLFSIINLKKYKWKPQYVERINNALNGGDELKNESLTEMLKEQLEIEIDFWKTYFSKYLNDDFQKVFADFELNRNHVAHNKMLDRDAYKIIAESTDTLGGMVKDALEKFHLDVISKEVWLGIKRWYEEEESYDYKQIIREKKESDAYITIRNKSEIMDLYENELSEAYSTINDALRFRKDIKIFELTFNARCSSGTFFSVRSKITGESLDFVYDIYIDDSEGEVSSLEITCRQDYVAFGEEKFCHNISYRNGKAEYNQLQGLYVADVKDEISRRSVESTVEGIIDYINDKLENLKEYVDNHRYSSDEDSGGCLVASGILCCECMKEYICIDDNIAFLGTCLNCGARNKIAECQRCGAFFEYNSDDDIKLCDGCKEYYENE